jgi:hypothetical protein
VKNHKKIMLTMCFFGRSIRCTVYKHIVIYTVLWYGRVLITAHCGNGRQQTAHLISNKNKTKREIMPGFNYGGNSVGDKHWSSERGSDPTTPGAGIMVMLEIILHLVVRHQLLNIPWGDLTTDAAGYAYMNGIKLTADNSQLGVGSG